jgi:nicotinamide-nucleotide amidase
MNTKQLVRELDKRGLWVATAESCTGGLVAAAFTSVPGASDVFERGFVTYSNDAKTEQLGVGKDVIAKHGAVSKKVAIAMAEGALRRSRADIAVSVTGVAGPGGGTARKPVGLVHFACAMRGRETKHTFKLFKNMTRDQVRQSGVDVALSLLQRVAFSEKHKGTRLEG